MAYRGVYDRFSFERRGLLLISSCTGSYINPNIETEVDPTNCGDKTHIRRSYSGAIFNVDLQNGCARRQLLGSLSLTTTLSKVLTTQDLTDISYDILTRDIIVDGVRVREAPELWLEAP